MADCRFGEGVQRAAFGAVLKCSARYENGFIFGSSDVRSVFSGFEWAKDLLCYLSPLGFSREKEPTSLSHPSQ